MMRSTVIPPCGPQSGASVQLPKRELLPAALARFESPVLGVWACVAVLALLWRLEREVRS